MSTLITTIILALIIVIICLGFLGLGALLTGKSKIKLGSCGRDPTKKDCGEKKSCGVCEDDEHKKH